MIRLANWLPQNSAALIYTDINRRYFTDFNSSLGYLLVSKNDSSFLVDGRYYIAAKTTVKNSRVELLKNLSEQVKQFCTDNKIDTVFMEDIITVAELKQFKKAFSPLSVRPNSKMTQFICDLRSVKTDDEIECIKAAQGIAEKAFLEVLNFIKPGVTERALATELDYRMKLLGSERESFDTIVVSGYKSAMPHGVPDEKKVSEGEFITFDFGAVCNGYHSDMTRTVAVGYVTEKMADVYETVLKAQLSVEKAVKQGVTSSNVDAAARQVIENAGYGQYFTHSTGHSVGLEIHETPNLSPKSKAKLKEGNIVTNEPGIYIENEFGVRIEDMLLVTKKGCVNLTKCPKNLIIL